MQKTHKPLCPKCHKTPVAYITKHCDACRAKSKEAERLKHIEYMKEYWKTHSRTGKPKQSTAPPTAPHKCRTESCETMVFDKKFYCDVCREVRDRASRRDSNFRRCRSKDVINKPSTGMRWLDDVNAVLAERGGIYYPKNTDMPKQEHVSKILRVRIWG